MKFISWTCSCLLIILLQTLSFAQDQSTIKGSVVDRETGETIIGAQVTIQGTSSGTISDLDGNFTIITEVPIPLILEVSSLGYQNFIYAVNEVDTSIFIGLTPTEITGEEIVISASRIEERILEAPVSIEKMGLLEIRYTPSADFFSGIANLKGVQLNTSSLGFQTVNTRGFGDAVPTRFGSFIDGMDLALPINSSAIGNVAGASELDIQSLEVVPGPGSALYGPSVFNGSLMMYTKDPFEFQGLSAYLKQGVTNQKGVKVSPYTDIGFRYAKVFNEKFALKINFTYLDAVDWTANDESYNITLLNKRNKEELLGLPRNAPAYDGIHVYGDEDHISNVDLGDGTFTTISRTGIPEIDLTDYHIQNFKLQWAAHYKLTEKITAMYDFRYAHFDATLRQSSFWHLNDSRLITHKLELKAHSFLHVSMLLEKMYLAS